MSNKDLIGGKVRRLRRRERISQVGLAEQLGISASYLNLIENNKRPLPAHLLIELARRFEVPVEYFASDLEAGLVDNLQEVFADDLFEESEVTMQELREMVSNSPELARSMLRLYEALKQTRASSEALADRVSEGESLEQPFGEPAASEQVTEFVQDNMNHFAILEELAESSWKAHRFSLERIEMQLMDHLREAHDIRVEIEPWDKMQSVLRTFDAERRVLHISELLPTRSRRFQLAYQVGMLEHHAVLDSLVEHPALQNDEARTLGRIILGNYFASAMLMPYGVFLGAAEEERYDIDVLGRRFRVGFEQVCHRLTSLRRPGAEGIPFHMLRVDGAGNISKRFSASGIRFARFGGSCPRWNVFHAFRTPGLIRTQIGEMSDGERFFCIARTIQRDSAAYHNPQPMLAIGLGCKIEHAHRMVYADHVALDRRDDSQAIGVGCRVCDRSDCEQRAFPSLRKPLHLDENVRGVTLYVDTRSD